MCIHVCVWSTRLDEWGCGLWTKVGPSSFIRKHTMYGWHILSSPSSLYIDHGYLTVHPAQWITYIHLTRTGRARLKHPQHSVHAISKLGSTMKYLIAFPYDARIFNYIQLQLFTYSHDKLSNNLMMKKPKVEIILSHDKRPYSCVDFFFTKSLKCVACFVKMGGSINGVPPNHLV